MKPQGLRTNERKQKKTFDTWSPARVSAIYKIYSEKSFELKWNGNERIEIKKKI